jgi:hypothetical protein
MKQKGAPSQEDAPFCWLAARRWSGRPINRTGWKPSFRRQCWAASVAWIESVMTSSFSAELVTRETAAPDSTP